MYVCVCVLYVLCQIYYIGNWGAWGIYGACSETCQSNINASPTQFRTRTCLGSTFGGNCNGLSTESRNCNSAVTCQGLSMFWSDYNFNLLRAGSLLLRYTEINN